jgi:hypothetical protein
MKTTAHTAAVAPRGTVIAQAPTISGVARDEFPG